MPIIDSQVHAYEANTPKRPWHSVPNWPAHVTGDEMVAAMDKVGVDGAIFISAFSLYQYDASYAVEVQRAHPGRFAIVKPVDPDDPAVGDVIADWKQTAGTVGIRIMLTTEQKRDPSDPGLDRIARRHWCCCTRVPTLRKGLVSNRTWTSSRMLCGTRWACSCGCATKWGRPTRSRRTPRASRADDQLHPATVRARGARAVGRKTTRRCRHR